MAKRIDRIASYYANRIPVESTTVVAGIGDRITIGPELTATRIFDHPHPSVRYMPLRFPGRGIQLGTMKQYLLWLRIARRIDELPPGKSWRTSLAELANHVGLSRGSVSRFLRRLDWFRAIDLCAIPGRNGGVYIWRSPKPSEDAPEFKNVPPHKLARARFKMLRHRVWQARFDKWRERYEEVREITKEWFHATVESVATFAR